MDNRSEFFARLGELLREFGVELVATDDDKPYGMHSGIIEFEFRNGPDVKLSWLDADRCAVLAEEFKT